LWWRRRVGRFTAQYWPDEREIRKSGEDAAFKLQSDNHALELRALRDATDASHARIAAEAKANLELLKTQLSARESELNALAAREREKFEGVLRSLRAELAAARSSVEIKAGDGYISVGDLLVDAALGRKLVADGYLNAGRVVFPDYAQRGWELRPNMSLAQIEAYIKKREMLLRPREEETAKPEYVERWAQNFQIFTREDQDADAFLGIWAFTSKDASWLLKNITTTSTNPDGEKRETAVAESVMSVPPGMLV
jgi:hypothetical protein